MNSKKEKQSKERKYKGKERRGNTIKSEWLNSIANYVLEYRGFKKNLNSYRFPSLNRRKN
jgi:protein subunit release factor B